MLYCSYLEELSVDPLGDDDEADPWRLEPVPLVDLPQFVLHDLDLVVVHDVDLAVADAVAVEEDGRGELASVELLVPDVIS